MTKWILLAFAAGLILGAIIGSFLFALCAIQKRGNDT